MPNLDELIEDAREASKSRDDTGWFWVGRLADALEEAGAERVVALAHEKITRNALEHVERNWERAEAHSAELERSLRSESLARMVDATLLHEYERRFAEAAKLHQRFDAPNGFRWCSGCSTDEYPEEWPCPTAVALGLNGGEVAEE